jgi:hypothetical protein
MFGFDHRNPKPGIFGHPTIKPFKVGHRAVYMSGFNNFYLQFISHLDLKMIITFCYYLRFS